MTANIALPQIDLSQCTGCGDCVAGCPTEAVALVGGWPMIVRSEACDYCARCEALCPEGAIGCPYEIVLVGNGEGE